MIATVIEWRRDEGWGIISADGVPSGIWVHFSAILMDGFKSLKPGEQVEAEVEGPLDFVWTATATLRARFARCTKPSVMIEAEPATPDGGLLAWRLAHHQRPAMNCGRFAPGAAAIA